MYELTSDMARTKKTARMMTGTPARRETIDSTGESPEEQQAPAVARRGKSPVVAVPGSRRLYRRMVYDPTQPIQQIPQTHRRPSAPTGRASATDAKRDKKAAWHKRVYETIEEEGPPQIQEVSHTSKKLAKAVVDEYFGPLADGQDPQAMDSTMAGAIAFLEYGRDYNDEIHNSVLMTVHERHKAAAEAVNAVSDAHDAGTQTDTGRFADPQVLYRAPPTLRRARSAQTWVRA